PFNPRASSHRNDDYCEGTAWQWSWFVPHDVNGLVALMGGKEKFITKLDSLFTVESALEGESTSMDISGLIGQYAHGNEPSHHIAHLYNYVGKPHRTQELLDSIIYSQYAPTPEGICGNEDCGQMSAWYIMNAMGLYQVAPGNPIYSIGRPIFDKMTINMEGNPLTIQTIHNSRKNKYVKSVSFNGVELTEPFITHDQLKQGGQLTFVMTDQPNE
ncbi:MAG: glycoside hydrolase domain-containing protein, partial [Bacteroidales bacterium]